MPIHRLRPGTSRVDQLFFGLLLAIFIAKGVVVTFAHPPFSGHDEVMHYAYLEYLATEGRIPVIPVIADWQEADRNREEYPYDRAPGKLWAYCRYVTPDWSAGCGDEEEPIYKAYWPPESVYYLHGWIYTANHPPLYYAWLTPVYWATDVLDVSLEAQLYTFRLATLPFGVLTVVMAWLTARTLFPPDRFLSWLVPAFVAFQPQISYEASMLNNDAMAIAMSSVVIYLLVRGLKSGFPVSNVALTGFFFGLAVLSKNTSATIGLSIAVAMVLGLGLRNIRQWLPKGALAAGISALLVWPWFGYMYRTYGDFTALGRVSKLQFWNYFGNDRPSILDQARDMDFAWLRWRETWGEFGWRFIPIGDDSTHWLLLRLLLWATLVAAIGIAVWSIRLYQTAHDTDETPGLEPDGTVFRLERWQVAGVVTMGVTCIIAYVAILQFGVQFSLTQARYYFGAIVPAAILVMLGFRALTPRTWLPWVQTAFFAGLVVLNILIYTAWVVPYWGTAARSFNDVNPFYR